MWYCGGLLRHCLLASHCTFASVVLPSIDTVGLSSAADSAESIVVQKHLASLSRKPDRRQ